MELFNSTGFDIGDKVSVVLSDTKYYGKVIAVDERLDRIKVDYASNSTREVIGWFHKNFWSK